MVVDPKVSLVLATTPVDSWIASSLRDGQLNHMYQGTDLLSEPVCQGFQLLNDGDIDQPILPLFVNARGNMYSVRD